jgi:selenide,water dikinase
MPFAPRPKAGVYAVRQAPVLHDNVRAALTGGAMRAFHPQKDYLKLVSLGDKIALAEKFGTAFVGPSLWSMKDSIDTKFMRQFNQVADMPSPHIATTVALGVREMLSQEPLCGGCGAKVGRAVLNEVIQTGAGAKLPEVTSIKGDDAAMIEVGGVRTVMTTDHLRAFANDPHLMTRIAVNHALGDVWAMGGKPKYVTMSLTLPRSNREIYQRTLHEVNHAASVGLAQAGAALVGGHTSIGSEFSIGFTVTGVLDGDPVTLAGAKPGDCLVLTKPIGSGVILAAEMRQLARGVDVASCYRQMLQGQGVAAKILAPDAHAMTDVTGFGLAGHLANINDASGTGTVLFGDAMPLMTGAKALSAMGVRSSLWPDNRQGSGEVFGEDHVNFDLLFDPQTAGGLLASVDGQKADDLVKKLWVSGYPAAVIGQVTDETGVLRLT